MATKEELDALQAKFDAQMAQAHAAAKAQEATQSNLASNLMGNLKGQLGDIGGKLDPSALGGMVSNLQNQASQIMGSVAGEASSLINSSLSQITSAFPSAAKDLFGTLNMDISSLVNKSMDQFVGLKEVNSKIESLASDSAGAIANPVSFISKPLNDVMQGVSTLPQGMGVKDALSGLSPDSLSNLSKSVGFSIDSGSDFTKALNTVTSDLSSKISGGSSSLTSMISDVVGPVTSSVNSFAGSFMSGISSTISGVVNSSGLSSISNLASSAISSGKDLTNAALNALPSSVRSSVKSLGASYISDMATNILGDNLSSYTTAYRLLSNTSQKGNILNTVLNLSNGSSYNNLTDSAGKSLFNLFGNNKDTDIQQMYKAAKYLCNEINTPSYMNYRSNKDLYDILMQYAGSMGLTDLMRQLNKCTGMDTSFFDNRTSSILKTSAKNSTKSGNVYTYGTVLDIVGSSNLKNSKNDMLVLNANMKANRAEVEEYMRILDELGYEPEDLVMDEFGNIRVLNGNNTILMTASNTKVIDSIIGSDNRKLVQGAMSLYNKLI